MKLPFQRSGERTSVGFRPSPAVLPLVCAILLLFTRLFKNVFFRGDGVYLSVVIFQIIIFLIPSVVWIHSRGEGYLSRLRLIPGKPESLLLTVSASLLLITGGLSLSILFSGIQNIVGTFTLYDSFLSEESGGISGPFLYSVLAYAALPAICEELLFRGILSAEYDRHGCSVSVLAGTIFFACVHFQFGGLPVYLFSGVVLSMTAYLTRSVWGAVLAHFLYNLFGLFGQPYIRAFYEITGSSELFIFVLVSLLLLSLAVFCGETARLLRLYAARNHKEIPIPRAKDGSKVPFRVRAKFVLLKPDAIGLYVVWLFASVLFLFIS